jgi:mRNA interferase RelE/StbE
VTYTVYVRPAAQKALRKLDPQIGKRLAPALRSLANEPRPVGAKALTGKPGWLRIRVGDYRIVYEVHDDELIVHVIDIGHRRDIYDH